MAAGVAVLPPDTHTITGTLTLAQIADLDAEPGDYCTGEDGYDDIGGGTQVTVEDESGTLLASAPLEAGESDGLFCRFDFTLDDVPDARQYQVAAGNDVRGATVSSQAELESDDWHLDLTLGS